MPEELDNHYSGSWSLTGYWLIMPYILSFFQVGQQSEPVLTDSGVHIILRTK